MRLALEPLPARALAVRTIPRVDPQLAAQLGLRPEQVAVGMLTATSDDALYVALDHGTKAAPVDVVYAKSFYAGAAHASGPLSGEVLGVYAAHDVEPIRDALAAAVAYLEQEACFYAADARRELAFFPHVVGATGGYLSREAGIPRGAPLAYLIAPPLESLLGLDAALKAAQVELRRWFGPPTETNFGGAWLTGELSACEAAAQAFAAAVVDVARHPRAIDRPARAAGEELGATPAGGAAAATADGRFRVLTTGERLNEKPEHLTHLRDDASLVPKTHPRMELRGKMDVLQGLLLDAQGAADAVEARALVGELSELLEFVRRWTSAEVLEQPGPELRLLGLDAPGLRYASHHTQELYGVPFMYPSVRHGPVVARLYLARAGAREAELAACRAFAAPDGDGAPTRGDLVMALNRLSSALYVLQCRYVGGAFGVAPLGPIKGWRPPAT